MNPIPRVIPAQIQCRRRPIFFRSINAPIHRPSCEFERRRREEKKSHESYAHAENKRNNTISPHPVPNNPDDNRQSPHNCTSLFTSLTSSPGLNAGSPMYGHPSHLNASPSAQFPHEPTLPCTVKSTSARSSACSLARLASAFERLAASSALSRSARPQLQSLQARRRLVLGLQASAVCCVSTCKIHE
jgi:hypothetical protein